MTEPIVALWWFFLIGALVITLFDVYLLIRVVGLCRQISALAKAALPAAAGIAKNTDAGRELGRNVELVGALAKKANAVEKLTATAGNQLLQEGR